MSIVLSECCFNVHNSPDKNEKTTIDSTNKKNYSIELIENYFILEYNEPQNGKVRARITGKTTLGSLEFYVFNMESNFIFISMVLIPSGNSKNSSIHFDTFESRQNSTHTVVDFNFVICDSKNQKLNYGTITQFYATIYVITNLKFNQKTDSRLANILQNTKC